MFRFSHGGHGRHALRTGNEVGARRHRHRRARGRLAGDEGPPGQVAPRHPEPLAAVDVRPTGDRVDGRKSRRRHRVAVGHNSGDDEPDTAPEQRTAQ